MLITSLTFDIHPTIFAIAAALSSMSRQFLRTVDIGAGMLDPAACVAAEIRMTPFYGKGGGGILLRVRHSSGVYTMPFRYLAIVPQSSGAVHFSSWVDRDTAIPPTEERMIPLNSTTRIFDEDATIETILRTIVEAIAVHIHHPPPKLPEKKGRAR